MHCQRLEYERTDMAFLLDKVANSPAGPAYQSYLAWTLAGLGREAEARAHLDEWMRRELAFDANWISAQAEAAEASRHARRPRPRATRSTSGSRPTPAAPPPSGRAVMSFGAIDRHLGCLAAVLGERDAALAHLRAAIERNAQLGCTVWRVHSQRALLALEPDARARRRGRGRSDRVRDPLLGHPACVPDRPPVGASLQSHGAPQTALIALVLPRLMSNPGKSTRTTTLGMPWGGHSNPRSSSGLPPMPTATRRCTARRGAPAFAAGASSPRVRGLPMPMARPSRWPGDAGRRGPLGHAGPSPHQRQRSL